MPYKNPSPLDVSEIRANLSTPFLQDLPIDLHLDIDSTNTQLKRQLSDKTFSLPRICLAEQQTDGKGQTLKKWHSPPNQNIYISFAFPFTQPLKMLQGFSLVTALALIKALSSFGFSKDIQIKWPNDVFYQDQKLVGILIETITQDPQQTHVVAGIGLNVNMKDTTESSITRPWTSLALISGKTQNRNTLTAAIIEQFFSHLTLFEQTGLPPFLDPWEQYDFLRGKEVTLKTTKGIYQGMAVGVNTRGQLLIQTPEGVGAHTSGELKW